MSETQRHTHESASAACDALALLRDGWADVDSIAPTAESIDAARSLAHAMVDLGCEFEIDGDVNGYVSITICGAARNAWFSVIDARRVVLTIHGEGAPESTHVGLLNTPTDAILRAIKGVSP